MPHRSLSSVALLVAQLTVATPLSAEEPGQPWKVPMLSPEESMAKIQVPDGYRLELVACEPMVEEPVAIEWDGDGRMYVAEMRTYMQDIDGEAQMRPISRVSLLEDTDGDGRMDRHAVFADGLVLPRMILPLGDRVIIRETDTFDLWSYRDTDGDGVSDEKLLWHEGGPRGGNLEHQPSGLVWNIDNWIYTTYSNHRYRFTRGQVEREPLPAGSGQWGLGQDDVGRLFYSTAGGETAAMDFQQPIVYGTIRMPGEIGPGFNEVFPIVHIPDVQGGRGRVRSDDTLNHFTGCAGQTVFRGDRLPDEMRGDLIIPEPVGRLIRRAKIGAVGGKRVLTNAYERSEFLRSTDPNFRPLNSKTGPDGCLYIVDMYRGIIQEGNWVRPGSYLREVVKAYSLQENIGRGRIYRLVHEDFERGPRPSMLSDSNEELVRHISHPNGWWRDNAQRLLILRAARDVVPALEHLATNGDRPLGRLHALWTLEGLDAARVETLAAAVKDADPRVRAAAVRIAEPLIAKRDEAALALLAQAAGDDDADVLVQVVLSCQLTGAEEGEGYLTTALERHPEYEALRHIESSYRARLAALEADRRRREEMRRANERMARSYELGRTTYQTLCVTCHGPDGLGAPLEEGREGTKAPALAGSQRVLGDSGRLVRILLHGLVGPVDGKTYPEQMVAMGSNDDAWISGVLNYVRNSWTNRGAYIGPEEIARVRKLTGDRRHPWTLAELHEFDPWLADRGSWNLASSHGGARGNAVDGNRGSRWDTGTPQVPGMWFRIELPQPLRITEIRLDTRGSNRDWPDGYVVHTSLDGEDWGDPVAEGRGSDPLTHIGFDPVLARHIRITQTGHKEGLFWSIHELDIASAPEPSAEPVDPSLITAPLPPIEELAALDGDASVGKAVFEKQCILCHRVGDLGVSFGPDLSAVGLRLQKVDILRSIVDPNATVAEGYRGVVMQTAQGEFLSGFIADEKDGIVTLAQQGGTKKEIVRKDIVFEETQETSFMPAGFDRALKEAEILGLAKYLEAQRDASRAPPAAK